MDKKWTVVDALRHSRHDWLNRLQLVKSHLSLGGVDRVHELIEEFVGEAQQEARLINLKMPLFAELLLTYSWNSPPCELDFEVLGEEQLPLTHLDQPLTTWTEQFFYLLHRSLDHHTENHLSVTVEQEAEETKIYFDFRGKLLDTHVIECWLTKCKEEQNNFIYSIQHEEICIEMQPIE